MACRTWSKAASAKTQIASAVPGASLEIIQLDTSKLTSVRVFAKAFQEKHQTLDLLVNNAGIMATPQDYTEDGFERQLATNYIGHFALTGLLMPQLGGRRGGSCRDLEQHRAQATPVSTSTTCNLGSKYSRWEAYGQTKLACLMFAYELDRKLKASRLDVSSVSRAIRAYRIRIWARACRWYYAPIMPLFR